MNNLEQELNDKQIQAVKHFTGPILILAGAGSGKTRALTYRIAHLINENNVEPEQILAVTFTNKATKEMKERLEMMLGDKAKSLWAATFHSTALKILRQQHRHFGYIYGFPVYDSQESLTIIKKLLKELGIDPKKHPASYFQREIDRSKNEFISSEDYADSGFQSYERKLAADVYHRYQAELLKSQAMDFGDLLVNVVKLFQKKPEILKAYQYQFKFILVDEFQDTNKVQYMLVKQLSGMHKNLFVVGDDDQSIYGFRGANIANILNFEKDFAGARVVKLEQNYRSTQTILDASNDVIAKNSNRKSKKLWTDSDAGSPIYTYSTFNEKKEADFIAKKISGLISDGGKASDIALLYRINAQSRALEEALLSKKIPYKIFGGQRFYDRKEIKDIIAYLRFVYNQNDASALYRIINTPARGIGPTTVNKIAELSKDMDTWEAVKEVASEKKAVMAFVELMNKLMERASHSVTSEIIYQCMEQTGYKKSLEDSKDITSVTRLENLQELLALSQEFNSQENGLQNLLDRISLASSADLLSEDKEEEEEKPEYVSLMTLHVAKGLEFPIVFLPGLEEGLLPHYRSLQTPSEIEEERRLCYVGMTRAKEKLFLTRAMKRGFFSSQGGFGAGGEFRKASRFTFDISKNLLEPLGSDFFADLDDFDMFDYEESDEPASDFKFEDKEVHNNVWFNRHKKKKIEKSENNNFFDKSDNFNSTSSFLEPEQIKPGIKVKHKHLGLGVVENLILDKKDESRNKVLVRFDSLSTGSELLLSKAKLELV